MSRSALLPPVRHRRGTSVRWSAASRQIARGSAKEQVTSAMGRRGKFGRNGGHHGATGNDVSELTESIIRNIDAGRAVEAPFFHLEFDRVFPDDIYAAMIDAMPEAADTGRYKDATGPHSQPGHRDPGQDRSVSRTYSPPYAEPNVAVMGFGGARAGLRTK